MIRVIRGDEPKELADERATRLPEMRALASKGAPKSGDFKGYGVAKARLKAALGAKCWYCEKTVEGKYEPVEHYRPKAEANRGSSFPKHGYWWLAWTWENLLFICDDCNRIKRTHFPLAPGSAPLVAEALPPGGEIALLIDPSERGVDPIDFIEFKPIADGKWIPFPRNKSELGRETINKLGLDGVKNRPGILDIYRRHVLDHVRPKVDAVLKAMAADDPREVHRCWDRARRSLLRRTRPFSALSYDAIAKLVPQDKRLMWRLDLPRPPWDPEAAR